MPLLRFDGPMWTGTREQVLRSFAASHNMPPALSAEEVLEVCAELGLPAPDLPPEGYVWDGSEY